LKTQKAAKLVAHNEQGMGEVQFDGIKPNNNERRVEHHGLLIQPENWPQQIENYQKWLILQTVVGKTKIQPSSLVHNCKPS
jgi:hypothetical protein